MSNSIAGQEVKRVWYSVEDAMPDDIYGKDMSEDVFLVAWVPTEIYKDQNNKTHFLELCEYYPTDRRFKPVGGMLKHVDVVILGWMNPLCDFMY